MKYNEKSKKTIMRIAVCDLLHEYICTNGVGKGKLAGRN
jgi:hypothetical protein